MNSKSLLLVKWCLLRPPNTMGHNETSQTYYTRGAVKWYYFSIHRIAQLHILITALAEISQQSLVSSLVILWLVLILPYQLKLHTKSAEKTANLSISSRIQRFLNMFKKVSWASLVTWTDFERLKLEYACFSISYTTIYRAIYARIFDTKAERKLKGNRGVYRNLDIEGKSVILKNTLKSAAKYLLATIS